jgi:hypothetical protein
MKQSNPITVRPIFIDSTALGLVGDVDKERLDAGAMGAERGSCGISSLRDPAASTSSQYGEPAKSSLTSSFEAFRKTFSLSALQL